MTDRIQEVGEWIPVQHPHIRNFSPMVLNLTLRRGTIDTPNQIHYDRFDKQFIKCMNDHHPNTRSWDPGLCIQYE